MRKINMQVLGTLKLSIKRADGSVLTTTHKNLITDWGLTTLAAALAGTAITPDIEYLALGTGSTAPQEANTALEAESVRVLASVAQLAGADSHKVQYNKAWTEGEVTGTFREAGLFNSASSGNMLNRLTFAEITVSATDTFEVTWIIEFKNV